MPSLSMVVENGGLPVPLFSVAELKAPLGVLPKAFVEVDPKAFVDGVLPKALVAGVLPKALEGVLPNENPLVACDAGCPKEKPPMAPVEGVLLCPKALVVEAPPKGLAGVAPKADVVAAGCWPKALVCWPKGVDVDGWPNVFDGCPNVDGDVPLENVLGNALVVDGCPNKPVLCDVF